MAAYVEATCSAKTGATTCYEEGKVDATATAKSEGRQYKHISGFADYSEGENYLFSLWKEKITAVFKTYGFTGFNPRPLEPAELLRKKGGVDKQIFGVSRLQDGSATNLAIPFDRTVPLATYIMRHMQETTFPFKRFDISHSFRGEHAAPGRFRGFIQADIDVIGPRLNLYNDVECIATILKSLNKLEIPEYFMYLNNIQIPKAIITSLDIPKETHAPFMRIIDKMDKIGLDGAFMELQALLPDSSPALLKQTAEIFTYKGPIASFFIDETWGSTVPAALEQLQNTMMLLERSGISTKNITFCPGMVRGLDYYTGVVFETFFKEMPEFGSIASGGRYDNLIDSLSDGSSNIEGVGGSIGLTRLFDILSRKELLNANRRTSADVLLAYRTPELIGETYILAEKLREQGVNVDLYTGDSKKISKQLGYANKKGIPRAIMVMAPEAYVIRNMTTSKQTPDMQSPDAVAALVAQTIKEEKELTTK